MIRLWLWENITWMTQVQTAGIVHNSVKWIHLVHDRECDDALLNTPVSLCITQLMGNASIKLLPRRTVPNGHWQYESNPQHSTCNPCQGEVTNQLHIQLNSKQIQYAWMHISHWKNMGGIPIMKSVPNRKALFCVSVDVHMAVWSGTFNYVITVCTRISWGNNKVNLWKAFWKSHGISQRSNTRFQVWFTVYWETLCSETTKTRQEITTSSFDAVIQHPSGRAENVMTSCQNIRCAFLYQSKHYCLSEESKWWQTHCPHK